MVKDTMGMLAESGMRHLAPFAKQAIDDNYVKPSKRIFDNAKVSDHFAIIPTLQAPQRPVATPSRSCTTSWCGASCRCSSRAPNTR